MPEQRGQKYHQGRLGEALREEIETILEGELGDPRIGLANVSEVKLSPDNKTAHVFVSVQGDEAEAAKTLGRIGGGPGFYTSRGCRTIAVAPAPGVVLRCGRRRALRRQNRGVVEANQ